MDFEFSPEEKRFRQEVEDFASREIPPGWVEGQVFWPGSYAPLPWDDVEFHAEVDTFKRKLGAKGWLTLSWPEAYGGQNSIVKQAIVDEVCTYFRMHSGGSAPRLIAPTMIKVASEEMKQKWLPGIASGEVDFWVGYSEPNAGSDLASLETRAEDAGDHFLVNGQKTWSSGAHLIENCLLLARTDPDAPKHKGITMMIVKTNSPGITISPITNICGKHSFNEVFFDNVKVPKENVVGKINRGFHNVALALQHERLQINIGAFKRFIEELIFFVKHAEFDGKPLVKDPLVRNRVAYLATEVEALYGLYWKIAWAMDQGQAPETEASALKLFASELGVQISKATMDILGPCGLLENESAWSVLQGRPSEGYIGSVSGPIGAGASEIQRTVIATRGLALPR